MLKSTSSPKILMKWSFNSVKIVLGRGVNLNLSLIEYALIVVTSRPAAMKADCIQ